MAIKKYLDYEGLQRVLENIDRKYAPIAALVFKGTVEDIAHLPSLATQKSGYMYNIATGGGTTSDFVEGAGHIVADGEEVAAVEVITGYTAVTPAGTENPKSEGWYELVSSEYVPTTDTEVDGTKNYFEATKVMKWSLLGGIFNLEDRYLEFGDTMPSNPEQDRVFLYIGDTTYTYTAVTPDASDDPSAKGWYEKNINDEYVLTTDTTVDSGKTYYEKEEQYVKGVIYVYDTTDGWVAQSAGDTYTPITASEVDSLFN